MKILECVFNIHQNVFVLHNVYVFDIFENRIDLFQFKLVNLSDNFDLSNSDSRLIRKPPSHRKFFITRIYYTKNIDYLLICNL